MDTNNPLSAHKESLRWYILAKRLAFIAVAVALITSILMIANYVQTKSIDPMHSKALAQLMLKLQQDPQNDLLKEQIRALDLLARRAYFTNQWQIRTGGFLLFISVLILLVSLKYIQSCNLRMPDLEKPTDIPQSWLDQLMARKYLAIGAIVLFGSAFILGIISDNEFNATGSDDSETVSFATTEELQQNWPAFRGPDGNGIAYQNNYPVSWDGGSGQNIIWKTEIPLAGFSSPIIWQDRIFLSGADKDNQTVYCIDRKTGNMIWQLQLNDISGTPEKKPKVTDDTGYAAPTMTTDGRNVYVIFATGDLAALDLSGNRIWVKNLGVPDNHYGHSSSLFLYKNILLIQYDHSDSKQLIGLMAPSGVEIYRTMRDVQLSWASPVMFRFEDSMQIVLNSNPFVIGYNPETGKELWRIKCMDGEVAPSPAYANGMVYVVNEYARLVAIKIAPTPEVIWEYEDDLSEVSSPLATSDLLFMASSYGAVTCFNNKTGEVLWNHEFEEGFYSSPVLAGEQVYLTDMAGVTQIFKADSSFQLVSQSPLGERAMTIPAFKEGQIYIRGINNLFCIGSGNE